MYACVRCHQVVALDDAICRSFAFGHCVCLRCSPAERGRPSSVSAPLVAAIEAVLAEAPWRFSSARPSGVCTLCNAQVPSDDVAVSTPRRCLCLRCMNRIAGRARSVPYALREWVSRILDEIEA
jgi:hypothetical protein